MQQNVLVVGAGPVGLTMAAELVVLAGFSAGWLAADGHPSGGVRLTGGENETLGFASRIGMGNAGRKTRDVPFAGITLDRRRIGDARPAQP